MPFLEDTSEFDLLRAQHRDQQGVMMAFIKDRVGLGTEYVNEVARVVLSESGGYYQLHEMPEEFAGALGKGIVHRLMPVADIRKVLEALETLTLSIASGAIPVETFSLYLLYAGGSLRERRSMFVCDCRLDEPPFLHGAWQHDALPRFFKLRLDADPAIPELAGLGLSRGVLFFLAPDHTDDGRGLLVTFARSPGAVDLGLGSVSKTLN